MQGHNASVDWWALGILIFEMLAGFPPFYADTPLAIYSAILGGKIEWPRAVQGLARDLVGSLLVADRTKRIGNLKNGSEDVKNHEWFQGVDWEEVYDKKLIAPFVPTVKGETDTSNFEDYSDEELEIEPVTEAEAKLFENF